MGNACTGVKVENKQDYDQSRAIDAVLRQERKVIEHEVKLLLLGAGESGKSTIAKQMKIIYLTGFSVDERSPFREVIHSNVIVGMRTLMLIFSENDLISKLSPENQKHAEFFLSNDILFIQELTPEIAQQVKSIWADPVLKENYLKYRVDDSAAYYFDDVERLSTEDYLPTEADVLRSRARTTGVSEILFNVSDVRFRMVDVGGQRSERKKWIHCFQDVTALIFCVGMSEYDMKLHEDETVNRMHESIMLFEEICNCQWFNDSAIILFLNKSDLFNEKIERVDLKVCFPEYTGGKDAKAGTVFLKDKFIGLNRVKGKPVYVHVTCATDTDNIRFVFAAVRDIVIRISISRSGV